MKLTTFRVVRFLTLITGCGVGSVQPLHQDAELLFDPQLVGTWEDSTGKESAALTADGARGYRLEYRDSDGKTGRFRARLGQLGSRRVLDVQPEDAPHELSDVYRGLLLPLHGFVFLEVQGQALNFAVLEADTLRRYLERNPTAVPHIALKDGILLTAPSSELRRFLAGYLARRGVLGEAAVWRRRGP